MKKVVLLCTLLSLFMFSCKKSDSGSGSSYNYLINGVADVTVNTNSSTSLGVEVKYSSGTQETVDLSVTGLPTGVSATITPASGTPTYTSVITFTASGSVAAGSYPIKIKGTSKSGAVKEYACNLKVVAGIDCPALLAGSFTGNENCTVGADNYTLIISKDNTGSNKITAYNLYNNAPPITVNATTDCTNRTLTIPTQTTTISGSTITVSGTGTFTATYDKVVINYTISDGTTSNSCTFTGNK